MTRMATTTTTAVDLSDGQQVENTGTNEKRKRSLLWACSLCVAACFATAASTVAGEATTMAFPSVGFQRPAVGGGDASSFNESLSVDFLYDSDAPQRMDHQRQWHRSLAAMETAQEKTCHSVSACALCTDDERKKYEACLDTGRYERFECHTTDDDDGEDEKSTEIRGCRRTQTDEQFALVWLELSCLVIGFYALVNVRKQKMISASLFDQRKRGIKPKSRRSSGGTSEDEEFVELLPMRQSSHDDVMDLALSESSSNPLEVI